MSEGIKDIIKFNSTPENLSIVENYIDKVCVEHNIGPDVYGNILISITEAVNNAIYHGNENDESKFVLLQYNIDNGLRKISFIIEDEGKGFDYDNLPDPTSPDNLATIGGRGVFLIKQLADWVIFNDQGNIIELQFKY
ncbi:MAG: ATP-binding protein [Chitinophagales bacterium]|nr:ATP-binding protein [Bacteroidota bacterium]MCB9225684.1 ATP-binding protein [Chitinophagales bacterium]